MQIEKKKHNERRVKRRKKTTQAQDIGGAAAPPARGPFTCELAEGFDLVKSYILIPINCAWCNRQFPPVSCLSPVSCRLPAVAWMRGFPVCSAPLQIILSRLGCVCRFFLHFNVGHQHQCSWFNFCLHCKACCVAILDHVFIGVPFYSGPRMMMMAVDGTWT